MIGFYNYTVILTYLSVVSASFGMYFSMQGSIKTAIFCLMFSGFCDMIDGPVARTRTKRTEEEKMFGIQIDSLCDMVSFGVQPAVLLFCAVYHLSEEGSFVRLAAAFVGCCLILCAVIRLAFFNVSEEERQKTEGSKKRTSYRGLPVTNVAFTMPLGYLSVYAHSDIFFEWFMIFAAALTAFLFILDFKMFKAHGKQYIPIFIFGVCVMTAVVLA